MQSALSIALIICLVGSALPVAAQEPMWPRVRELDSGAEIAVIVKGSGAGQRYFIAADQSSLTVLNAAEPGISAAVKQVLVDTATDHPIYFVLAQQDKTFLLNGNVHLTREGIFVGDQKVAELEQIVVQIARDSIAEISVRERRVGKATGWGAAIGGGAGLVAGLLAGSRRCRTRNCTNFPPIAYGMIYSTFGGGIGSGLGALIGAARGKIQEVIYRAP